MRSVGLYFDYDTFSRDEKICSVTENLLKRFVQFCLVRGEFASRGQRWRFVMPLWLLILWPFFTTFISVVIPIYMDLRFEQKERERCEKNNEYSGNGKNDEKGRVSRYGK